MVIWFQSSSSPQPLLIKIPTSERNRLFPSLFLIPEPSECSNQGESNPNKKQKQKDDLHAAPTIWNQNMRRKFLNEHLCSLSRQLLEQTAGLRRIMSLIKWCLRFEFQSLWRISNALVGFFKRYKEVLRGYTCMKCYN